MSSYLADEMISGKISLTVFCHTHVVTNPEPVRTDIFATFAELCETSVLLLVLKKC